LALSCCFSFIVNSAAAAAAAADHPLRILWLFTIVFLFSQRERKVNFALPTRASSTKEKQNRGWSQK
jgi:hypothetical protein